MTTDEAIDIVARHVLACMAAEGVDWEDYPEIGEYDWERVADRIDVIAPFPDAEQSERAYAHLTEPAPSVALGHNLASWCWQRPATTVQSTDRIAQPGHHERQFDDAIKAQQVGRRALRADDGCNSRAALAAAAARPTRTATTKPQRIQMKRVRGWRKPEGVVYVGRPTKWGNPFSVAACIDTGFAETVAEARPVCVFEFRSWLTNSGIGWAAGEMRRAWMLEHLDDLRGRDLACWCPLDQPCHADVLLELANRRVAS